MKICIVCQHECVPAGFIAGKDGHMHAICEKCIDQVTTQFIRLFEDDTDNYAPGLIEEQL